MVNTEIDEVLVRFNTHRDALKTLADQAKMSFSVIGLEAAVDNAESVIEKIQSDTLKVLFLGDFKQGKSTLINAMLGKRVLPAYSIPCTAVINEIKYGALPNAVVHFENGSNPNGRSTQFEKGNRRNAENQRIIAVEEIESYVVIKDDGANEETIGAKSPIEYIEIFWPLDLCKHGIEIIDSPGLNEHETRTNITRRYLNRVDAVVFVMSCLQLGSKTEIDFIKNVLREEGHRDIIFACNRIDQVKRSDRDRIIDFGHKKLRELTDLGSEGIFFLSAEVALEGKEISNRELLALSNFQQFESKLSNFLVKSRGKIKLLQSARQILVEINRCLSDAIPSRLSVLKESLLTIERRYEEMKPKLDSAREKWQVCELIIDQANKGIVMEVQERLKRRFQTVASEIPTWIEQIEFEEKYELFNLHEWTPAQCNRIQNEARRLLTDKLELEYTKTIREVVPDAINRGWEQVSRKIGVNLRDLEVDLASARAVLFGESKSNDIIPLPNALERVLAGSFGFLLGGPGSAYVGGTFGATEMVKSVVPSIVLGIGTIAFGITNPWIIIPALATAALVQSFKHSEKIMLEIRRRTAEEIQKTAEIRCSEVIERVTQDLDLKCKDVLADLKQTMLREIRTIEDSVEDVLKQKKLGEKNCFERSSLLQAEGRTLEAVRSKLSEIVFEIAEEA